MIQMLKRKIIAASISGTLFAILLGFILSNPLDEKVVAEQNYLHSVSQVIMVYLMYSLPVVLIYGVLTSMISDTVARFILKKSENKNIEVIISGVFHFVFGLILLPFSLIAATLFFITDLILQKHSKNFNWLIVIKSFIIPLTTFIISVCVTNFFTIIM